MAKFCERCRRTEVGLFSRKKVTDHEGRTMIVCPACAKEMESPALLVQQEKQLTIRAGEGSSGASGSTSRVLADGLGVEALDGAVVPLLAPGTAVPAQATAELSTTADEERVLQITLIGADPQHPKKIAGVTLRGIPSAPRGVPALEVTVRVDRQGS